MRKIYFIHLVLLGVILSNSASAQSGQSIWSGIFSDAQAQRGAGEYAARCASCHAVDLRGNSNSPSLLGMSFMFLWEGRSVGELYNKIRTEMPSDQPGSLSAQSYLDIVTFILRENQYPAAGQDLAPDQAALDLIMITPQSAQ